MVTISFLGHLCLSPNKMPPVGKLSSVLAQFEQTIEKNNAAGVASGMYLTKLASSSKDASTKHRNRSSNTISTSSSHSSKKSGKEHSSRTSRSSMVHDRNEKQTLHKRSDQQSSSDKKEWNRYLEKTKTSLLKDDDDSSISEISQDSFGFDEIPFEDPFQKNEEKTAEFNPFGLEDIPPPSDSCRKQRPLKEKRGIGRLGNRTTKAKLDVKAAKKSMGKDKRLDDNDEESHNDATNNNNDDDDEDEEDEESEESGPKSRPLVGRNGTGKLATSGARSSVQRGESFKRSKAADVDRQSSHGNKYSPGRRRSHDEESLNIGKDDDEESETSGRKSKRVGGRNGSGKGSTAGVRSKGTDVDRQSSHGSKYSPGRRRSHDEESLDDNKDNKDDDEESEASGRISKRMVGRSGSRNGSTSGARGNVQRGESFKRSKGTDVDRHSSHGNKHSPGRRQSSDKEIKHKKSEEEDEVSDGDDGFSLTYIAKRDGVRGSDKREESFSDRKSQSLHNRTTSAGIGDRNHRSNNTRNTSPARSNGRSRKEHDLELNPERLSPDRQVMSFRDSTNKAKSLHSRSLLTIDNYDSIDSNNDSTTHKDDSAQTRYSKSMHTRKLPSTLEPSSAQSRFFGGNGESKIKVRTKVNASGTSSRASRASMEKRLDPNQNKNSNSMDRSDHSKQSHVSNASTKMSTDSLRSSSKSKLQMLKKMPSGKNSLHHSSSQLNYNY